MPFPPPAVPQFGMLNQPPPQPGMMGAQQARAGGFGGMLNANPNMLMAMGAGLLDHRRNATATPLSSVFQNAMYGGQFDTAKKKERKEEATLNHTVNWLKNKYGMSDDDAQAAVANPAILSTYLKPKSELMSVGADSALFNPETGEWIQPPGGGGGKPTDDMREYETAKSQGFNGTFMDYLIKMKEAGRNQVNIDTGVKLPTGYQWKDPERQDLGVEPIVGGPATQMPAELAARIGLARDALPRLEEAERAASEGQLTGIADHATGKIGWGDQGRLFREVNAGSEALLRMLTGAGMNMGEAQREVSQYLPRPTDDAPTLANKISQLRRRLEGTIEMATRGRGDLPPVDGASQSAAPSPDSNQPDPFGIR